MKTFNWGLLGTGSIARSMADALQHVPGALRAAVASRTQAKADAFAARWGVATAHGSYAALFADPAVEIVYIATPNACHKDNILDAIAAGKHVLCEKPLTLSEVDSRACAAAARKAGLFLMEAMWTAFFPATRKAVAFVQEGAIGTPRHLTANFVAFRDPSAFPNLYDPALGGGASLDLGIYPVTIAQLLAGPVASASAQAVVGTTGVDEMVAMSLTHESGVLSQLSFGFRVDMPVAATVVGDSGTLEIPHSFHHPERLIRTGKRTRDVIDLPAIGNGYAHEAIAVQRCIAEGRIESPDWTLENTFACARLVAIANPAA